MYNNVVKFIEACGQEPSDENAKLYSKLITEEYGEFIKARWNNDDVEQLDACMDMIWVILGYCKMKGFNVDGAWAEVTRSNLDKINLHTGKVIKREDGKVWRISCRWPAPVPASARRPAHPAAARKTESCARSESVPATARTARWIPPPAPRRKFFPAARGCARAGRIWNWRWKNPCRHKLSTNSSGEMPA